MLKLDEVIDLYITFAQAHSGPSTDLNLKVFLDQLGTTEEKEEFKELVGKADFLIQCGEEIRRGIEGLPNSNISLDAIIGVGV